MTGLLSREASIIRPEKIRRAELLLIDTAPQDSCPTDKAADNVTSETLKKYSPPSIFHEPNSRIKRGAPHLGD